MPISRSNVEHIAGLARIKLSEKEKDELTRDLGSVLGYINKLNEVNTDNIEPTAQITGLEDVFRKDEAMISEERIETASKIIAAATHKENSFIKVRQVFENVD